MEQITQKDIDDLTLEKGLEFIEKAWPNLNGLLRNPGSNDLITPASRLNGLGSVIRECSKLCKADGADLSLIKKFQSSLQSIKKEMENTPAAPNLSGETPAFSVATAYSAVVTATVVAADVSSR